MNYIQGPKRESFGMTALVVLMCSTSKRATKASEPGVMFCSESELRDLLKHLGHRSTWDAAPLSEILIPLRLLELFPLPLEGSSLRFGSWPSPLMVEEGPCRGEVASHPRACPTAILPGFQKGFGVWTWFLSCFVLALEDESW